MLKDNQFLMVNSQIKVLRFPSRVRKEFKFSKTLHPSIHPLPCVSLEWLNHPNFPLFLSDKSPRHGPGTDQKDKHHRLDFIKNEKMCCSLKYRASKKIDASFLRGFPCSSKSSMSSAWVIQSMYPHRSSSICCFSLSFWKSPRALAFSLSLLNSLDLEH